jgi:signal transduction histidine kinase
VAQDIAATPTMDVLFRQVVNLVQRRFGYYHAHVYTLEDGDLVMQEGTGEAGQKIKESRHKIPLAAKKSLVARASRSGKPVLVADVSQDPSWLPNPLLPETKSELAVPIMLGDQVLGVLDVQNDTVGTLDEEDQILLMGLCGQIAVAINNHRLDAKRKEAEEAQQKLVQELDAFAHTVGHNLRDTLALIIGYADLLKEQARLPEELQEFLNAIARNGRKMNTVIEELELLAGIRTAEIELKPLNMARIIAEVTQRLAYLIEEFQAEITVSEYWPVAMGHTPWVEEVWANYISNALKYGGTPPKIQLGATERSDGMIRFWVRDNGPGLSPEDQTQLFTKFTLLTQSRAGGYGLGLSIVRRIVTKFGGEIGCESEVGEGSVFYFTLPSSTKFSDD